MGGKAHFSRHSDPVIADHHSQAMFEIRESVQKQVRRGPTVKHCCCFELKYKSDYLKLSCI